MRMRLAWKHSEGAGYAGGFYFLSCISQSRRGRKQSVLKAKTEKGTCKKHTYFLIMFYSEHVLLQLAFFAQSMCSSRTQTRLLERF